MCVCLFVCLSVQDKRNCHLAVGQNTFMVLNTKNKLLFKSELFLVCSFSVRHQIDFDDEQKSTTRHIVPRPGPHGCYGSSHRPIALPFLICARRRTRVAIREGFSGPRRHGLHAAAQPARHSDMSRPRFTRVRHTSDRPETSWRFTLSPLIAPRPHGGSRYPPRRALTLGSTD